MQLRENGKHTKRYFVLAGARLSLRTIHLLTPVTSLYSILNLEYRLLPFLFPRMQYANTSCLQATCSASLVAELLCSVFVALVGSRTPSDFAHLDVKVRLTSLIRVCTLRLGFVSWTSTACSKRTSPPYLFTCDCGRQSHDADAKGLGWQEPQCQHFY